MSKVIPILRMFDFEKTVAFYVDWLEFAIDWEHRFEPDLPLYMQVSKDDIVLHLSEHHGDGAPGTKVFIEYSGNLETYHDLLIKKRYKHNRPGLEQAPWDATIMEVIDPSGNRIIFNKSNQEAE